MALDIEKRAKVENEHLKVLYADEWRDVELNAYENIKIISAGANGVTLVGRHIKTWRNDCIKIYTPNPRNRNKEVSIEQYLKEVRKLALLNDPHVVTIYDAFDTSDGIHVVTMQYIEGKTLEYWLKEKKVCDETQDYTDRLYIARQILDTVLRYQEKGVIHGDLHLKNVLVDLWQRIHIIDFGTSHFAGHEESSKRESFFVYDMVRQILGPWFDEKYFSIYCPKSVYNKKIQKDVREKYPILITKTMLAYVNTMDLGLQLPLSSLNASDIVMICVELTSGIYIEFDYAIKTIWSKVLDKKIDINIVGQMIFENIDAHINPDELVLWLEPALTFQADLIEIYYQLMLKTRARWDVEKTKNHLFSQYNGQLGSDGFDAYMNTLMEADEPTYFEFMCSDTTYMGVEDEHYKMIMYEALLNCLGDLSFYNEIWIRLNERRWERKLKDLGVV